MPKASKFLVRMLGADYHLLVASNSEDAIRRFNRASLILVLIWVLTFLSVYHAMDLLFHSWYMQWGLAVFIASLLILMYVFLINTFTKESFSTRKALTFSNISRTGFVLFMAFVLSKPLEIWINEQHYAAQVSTYKERLNREFSTHLRDLYKKDELRLAKRAAYLNHQSTLIGSAAEKEELSSVNQQLQDIQRKRELSLINAQTRIDESPFFLFQVKCATGCMRAWLLCVGLVALFILPGYLIYTIPPDDRYVVSKLQQEHKSVETAFNKFLDDYLRVFSRQQLPVKEYSTVWQDPPFNTVRKDQLESGSQEDFLKKWGPFS